MKTREWKISVFIIDFHTEIFFLNCCHFLFQLTNVFFTEKETFFFFRLLNKSMVKDLKIVRSRTFSGTYVQNPIHSRSTHSNGSKASVGLIYLFYEIGETNLTAKTIKTRNITYKNVSQRYDERF